MITIYPHRRMVSLLLRLGFEKAAIHKYSHLDKTRDWYCELRSYLQQPVCFLCGSSICIYVIPSPIMIITQDFQVFVFVFSPERRDKDHVCFRFPGSWFSPFSTFCGSKGNSCWQLQKAICVTIWGLFIESQNNGLLFSARFPLISQGFARGRHNYLQELIDLGSYHLVVSSVSDCLINLILFIWLCF